jgi:hypothetical protein
VRHTLWEVPASESNCSAHLHTALRLHHRLPAAAVGNSSINSSSEHANSCFSDRFAFAVNVLAAAVEGVVCSVTRHDSSRFVTLTVAEAAGTDNYLKVCRRQDLTHPDRISRGQPGYVQH